MTFFRWVIRSLTHYWRTHLAVALAAATATAVLTGALLVGDSVKATLRYSFVSRLGNVGWVMSTRERFFTLGLGQRLKNDGIDTASVLQVRGMVTKGDGSIRVNQVRVLGVDESFFKMSPKGVPPEEFGDEKVLVNTALASRLKIAKGGEAEVVLRFENPSAISRNLVLAPNKDGTISMRLPVSGVVDDEHFGRFSLEANQQEPFNLFVPVNWLQKSMKRVGRANLLLINDPSQNFTAYKLNQVLRREWHLEDVEAGIQPVGENTLELSSSRVFLDHSFGVAASRIQPDALKLLTYFVNDLRVNDLTTPYSMVTAGERKGGFSTILPQDMKDDEIVINRWLADDLNARAGDELTLTYFMPSGWHTLAEASRTFKICRVIPIEGAAADPGLTPDIPGLSDSENCRDWDPSLPIDLDRIRDKDEKYWDDYRGTPKAFITLFAGESMWGNTYGDLTAVRFRGGPADRDTLEENLLKLIDPASLGLSVVPVREKGARASRGGTDFGQLFLGLSMFLIASGILLTWLLFIFSIEGRRKQTGILLAIGFPVKKIRKLYLMEGSFVAFSGAVAGSLIALVYTRIIIWVMSNAWQGAVAGMSVRYSVSLISVGIGAVSGFLIALIAMIWTLNRQVMSSAHALLSGTESSYLNKPSTYGRRMSGWAVSIISFAVAVLLLFFSGSLGSSAMAGAFFGAGTLLLISVMIWSGMLLSRIGNKSHTSIKKLSSFALHNSARRRGRSMAVIALLACGVFMVVAVGANRKDPGAGADLRSSGTGGFALYAESSIPVMQDLNTAKGRSKWGLDPSVMQGTEFLSLRVREGDDASCLNLNRTQEPGILGVSVDRMADLNAFSFQGLKDKSYQARPWELLRQNFTDNVIPAVGDYPTVYWGLGKKIGDILIYHNRKGEKIRLQIVGMLRSSILQGSLLISRDAMMLYFPEVEGYRAWLIDTPFDRKKEISEYLTERMADAGLSVETAVERMELFSRMEDTYLSIFLVLGGLGLILGCIGLGLVVARNLLERQGELAMMRAVGFSKRTLMKMICYEHFYLLAAGLIAGLICALISVVPALDEASGQLPFGLLGVMILMIIASGVVWVVVSTRIALRGDILTPLRNE